MSDIFYCYSANMHYFLKALGFRYESVGVNERTNTKYHTYRKSDKLDDAIFLWNEIKHKIS